MNILITGATGYIGSALALKLAYQDHTIHALVRNPSTASVLRHRNIKLMQGNINDLDSVMAAMEGCEQVYHLAAFARLWAKPSGPFFTINVEGTRNMLETAGNLHISKFVHTSSTAVFGNSFSEPMSENDPRTIGFSSDYDLSKCMAEKLVVEYAQKGLNALIVNPSRVYGAGIESYSNPFCRFIRSLINGKPVPVPGCPDVISNYSYLEDVVNGHILAMQNGKAGERYILGGENISYRELRRLVKELIPGSKLLYVPKIMLKSLGAAQMLQFYFTKKQPSFTPAAIDRYFSNAAFSCRKAVEELNYKITPFKEGISQTIHHLKNEKQ